MNKQTISTIISLLLCFTISICPSYAFSYEKTTFSIVEGTSLTSSTSVNNNKTDSYIFQLTEDIAVDAEPINYSILLYRTSNFGLIEELLEKGILDHYYKDGTLHLDGFTEEIEQLKNENYRSAMLGYDYIKNTNVSGAGIKIAVIDSGLWTGFSDCTKATILEGTNFLVDIDSEDRHNTEDNYGHGTFVTSIICSSEAGIAAGVSIIPLKTFDSNTADSSYTIEAVYSAVNDYHCDIINLSLGSTEVYQDFEDAIQYALDQGVFVVASTGNIDSLMGSSGNDQPFYPAAHEGVIGVGAVDNTKTVWKHSAQNVSVDFVAPGVLVSGLSKATGKIVSNNGTSFSAPVVTGTIALALSVDNTLTLETVSDLLKTTSEDLGIKGRDNSYGYGLINPALLVATLLQDQDSIILSAWNNNIGLSAYSPAKGSNILAFYDNDGKMQSIKLNVHLNNYVIPTSETFATSLKLFYIELEGFVPICSYRFYY